MFHRIWLTEGTKRSGPPAAYEENWAAWQRQYPDREFRTWTEEDVSAFESVSLPIAQAQGMARKADIFRYAILEQVGGIYLDCDIEPFHRPAYLEDNRDILVCNEDENPTYCSIGFIAAPAGQALFRGLVEEIRGTTLNLQDPNIETGPHLFGRHLRQASDVRRLPTASFYPYHVHEPRASILSRDLSGTAGIHQWGASWASDLQHQSTLAARVMRGDALEIEEAVRNGRIAEGAPLITLSRELRTLRDGYASLAMNHCGRIAPFDLTARRCLEFLNILYWLQKKSFDITVWQVGAADGILVDPLRPFMVMFDPQAVLVEPNPWMFAKLKANYARNRNIFYVNAALTEEDGNVTMNCVVPDEVQARNLPDWVLGISSIYSDRNALDGRDLPRALHDEIRQSVRRESVQGLCVASVCQATGAKLPSVLVVDAEGMDAQIIASILSSGAKPYLIHFEHCNLDDQGRKTLNDILRTEFIIMLSGNDATAIRKDVLLTYCRDIWVEHGMQSIFTPIFTAINPFRA